MSAKVLNFSFNWNNKLECQIYTTIRMFSCKYEVGKQFDVHLKDKFHHRAEVVQVKSFYLNQVNEFMAGVDTGYSVEECKRVIRTMYKGKADTSLFAFVLLKKIGDQPGNEGQR